MKRIVYIWSIIFLITLSSCAPQIIKPQEIRFEGNKSDLFELALSTLNKQGYPVGSSGWIVNQSDQAGGFLSASLQFISCSWIGLSCRDATDRFSLTLADREDGTVAVGIASGGEYGHDLANAVMAAYDASYKRITLGD